MTQPERVRGWSMGLFLVGVLGFLSACSSPGGDGCGGVEAVVSCVTVTSVEPITAAGVDSSTVDAFKDDCTPPVLADYNANIEFSNTPFPGGTESLPVNITRVTISYTLNNCPASAVCPPLPGQDFPWALQIPMDGTASDTFPFVPISVQVAYVDGGGSRQPPPSYSANYTFTAQTQGFTDTFAVQASASFSIGDFPGCP
jgi:hypothetical protein